MRPLKRAPYALTGPMSARFTRGRQSTRCQVSRGCCPNAVCCCRCASAKRGSFISRRNSAFHRDATTPKRAKTGLGNTPLILDTSLRSTLHPSKPAAVMDSAIHKITERPGSHLCFRGLSRPPVAIGVTAKTDSEFVLNRPLNDSTQPPPSASSVPFTPIPYRGCVRQSFLFVPSW